MLIFKPIPDNTNIKFLSSRYIAFVFSLCLIVLSIAFLIFKGINFGIDFKGGIVIEFETEDKNPDLNLIRENLSGLELGDFSIKEFGATNDLLLFIELLDDNEDETAKADNNLTESKEEADVLSLSSGEINIGEENLNQELVVKVQNSLFELFEGKVNYRRIEVVGPKVSGELIQKGFLAVILSLLFMLIYIWYRFEWQFSVGAVMALMHDVFITVGIFAFTQIEFNLSIVAALLTIVGYSMNDTVIVFDRIRENLIKFRKKPIGEIINFSLNETLTRTIMTSFTTLIAVTILFFLGPESIKGFTFTMIWGIIIGTYSSIFIASPILLKTYKRKEEVNPGKL